MSASTTFPAPQRLSSPAELAATAVVALLLAMLAIMIGLANGVRGSELGMLAMSLLMLITATTPLMIGRTLPVERRHILLSLWSAGMGVYFAVPVFTQYFFVSEEVEGILRIRNMDPPDILNGQLIALLALLMTYVGYFYPVSRVLAQFAPKSRVDWSHQAALTVALVMIPVGWAVTVGGQLGLIPSRLGSGALGSIAMASYIGLALLSIIVVRHRSRPALLIAILFLIPTMLLAFLTGSKRLVLSPVMCIALGYFVCVRRIQLRWIVVGALILILLYPVASFYREVVLAGNQLRASDVITNPGRMLALLGSFVSSVDPIEYLRTGIASSTSRLDALGILSVIVRDTPDRVPYQGGWTLGHVFIAFIPRLIWPGKPSLGIGQWITDNYASTGPIDSNTGSSWVGEFYLNFGVLGVIVGMLFIGMYFRLLHEMLFRSMTIPALFAGVVVLWATCTTIEMNLLAPVNGTIFTLIPVMLAHLGVRTLSRPARPLQPTSRVPLLEGLGPPPRAGGGPS